MKFLLLGANGQLGRTFLRHGGLSARGTVVAASRDGVLADGGQGVSGDLADLSALRALLERERPDVIVNAAAYTAVDNAEANEALATVVNGEAPALLGNWAASHKALVIHYSTDYVFAGNAATPYIPSAEAAPQSAYGRSKLVGEIALRNSGASHMTFRTAWVYSAVGNNFLRTMLRLGADRDELGVVADQRGTPTSTDVIVDGTLAAIDRYTKAGVDVQSVTGTFHLTASGETTWHGFAEAIFDEAYRAGLLSKRPHVRAITTAEFPTPARRPAFSVLNTTSFSEAFGYEAPSWRDGLRRIIHAISTP